jgi:metal-responsive CopG/Arc/MetJ family transcriptional regulator
MKKTYDLPKDLIEEMKQHKEKTGVSYSALVTRAVRKELARDRRREVTSKARVADTVYFYYPTTQKYEAGSIQSIALDVCGIAFNGETVLVPTCNLYMEPQLCNP